MPWDLVVCLGELQRRISASVYLVASTDEVYIHIGRAVPDLPTWRIAGSKLEYHLRHTELPDTSRNGDFVFAGALLSFLNLDCPEFGMRRNRWHPTHMGMTLDCEEYRRAEELSQRFLRMTTDNVCCERNRELVLCLRRSDTYCWDADTWHIFEQIIFDRRRAMWEEVHVWPDALTFYHLLTRRGLAHDCAAHYMKCLIVIPRIARFRVQIVTSYRKKKHIRLNSSS